jgi:proteasome lid subunit RPN8/RPN11
MSSEIQFGDLEHNEPQVAVRPDRDGQFCIAQVGQVGEMQDDELPIFVDLDVMRDMEAHAISNTRVELGGVMLGRQCVDSDGKPFVTITNSLRAEHYQATRGSFKFTHETWNQITNQRNQFQPDLEMVGWYHTHPGWTVFLSPMDLFICNNFFNRPLDVALVIDPCAQDRGWFQWDNTEHGKQTQRTGGFYLTTNRYRQAELLHFARLYNKEPEMNADPRYSGNPVGFNHQTPLTAMPNRSPILDLVLVGMLMSQLFFMGWMFWSMNSATNSPALPDPDDQTAQVDQTIEIESLKTALTILASQNGDPQLGETLASMESHRQQLEAGLDGQLARVELLTKEVDTAKAELNMATAQKSELKESLAATHLSLDEIKTERTELVDQLEKVADGKSIGGYSLEWLLGTAFITTLLGGLSGYILARNKNENDIIDGFDNQDRPDKLPDAAIEFESDSTSKSSVAANISGKD